MVAKATLRYGTNAPRDYTPSADRLCGELVLLPDNRVGVCIRDIASGQLGAVYVDGVFACDSASATTIAIGGVAYVDISDSNNAIPTASKATGDWLLGNATKAKVSGDLTMEIDLNAKPGTISP